METLVILNLMRLAGFICFLFICLSLIRIALVVLSITCVVYVVKFFMRPTPQSRNIQQACVTWLRFATVLIQKLVRFICADERPIYDDGHGDGHAVERHIRAS